LKTRSIRNGKAYGFKMKNPQEIVDFAVGLSKSVDPAYSSRDISRMILAKFGTKVSNVTVSEWILRTQSAQCEPAQSPIDSLVDVPCYRCLVTKDVTSYDCNPAACLKLDSWLMHY